MKVSYPESVGPLPAEEEKSAVEDYQSRLEALEKEIATLQEQAGIAKTLEEPLDFDWGMDSQRDQKRDTYFKVPDKDLRLRLIKKERERSELLRRQDSDSKMALWGMAQDELREIESTFDSGLDAAIEVAIGVLIGGTIGNFVGGLAGAVVGAVAVAVFAMILSIHSIEKARFQKARDFAYAKEKLDARRRDFEETMSREAPWEEFSPSEELTGEPDQQP